MKQMSYLNGHSSCDTFLESNGTGCCTLQTIVLPSFHDCKTSTSKTGDMQRIWTLFYYSSLKEVRNPLNGDSETSRSPIGQNQRTQGEVRQQSYAEPRTSLPIMSSRPDMRMSDSNAVFFYCSSKPYYEFTNFAPYSVCFQGSRYSTAEHAFQAQKFVDSRSHREDIRQCGHPRAALDYARHHEACRRDDWFQVNVEIMHDIIRAKFSQHSKLRRMLLETGKRPLIEDSGGNDEFWGNGRNGHGRNELGRILMLVREEFKQDV